MDLPRDGSLPLMDLDSLPDELVGVDDMFVDNYLKGVEGETLVLTGLELGGFAYSVVTFCARADRLVTSITNTIVSHNRWWAARQAHA